MNPKTLLALQGSIQKWKAIAANRCLDLGSDNCPLCHLFHPNYQGELDTNMDVEEELPQDQWCDGCPVKDQTGIHGCLNSPYTYWIQQIENDIDDSGQEYDEVGQYTPEALEIAKDMVAFLQSLLPHDHEQYPSSPKSPPAAA